MFYRFQTETRNNMKIITSKLIGEYEKHLINEEKSKSTIQKYLHNISEFKIWLNNCEATKNKAVEYKLYITQKYAVTSANSIISSLNSFFSFIGCEEFKVKIIKTQKRIFTSEEKELSKDEYARLLSAAQNKKDKRLYLLMQCICSTGIRVSEVKYITIESLIYGRAEIDNKGKRRVVFIPSKLCKALKTYAKSKKIKSGAVFVSKNGKPLDRSNISSDLKKLCESAGVSKDKVFPHNLRHLFARTYYSLQKDIVRLADILGHSSVNTTRIYTMETGEVHKRHIDKLGLLRC